MRVVDRAAKYDRHQRQRRRLAARERLQDRVAAGLVVGDQLVDPAGQADERQVVAGQRQRLGGSFV